MICFWIAWSHGWMKTQDKDSIKAFTNPYNTQHSLSTTNPISKHGHMIWVEPIYFQWYTEEQDTELNKGNHVWRKSAITPHYLRTCCIISLTMMNATAESFTWTQETLPHLEAPIMMRAVFVPFKQNTGYESHSAVIFQYWVWIYLSCLALFIIVSITKMYVSYIYPNQSPTLILFVM